MIAVRLLWLAVLLVAIPAWVGNCFLNVDKYLGIDFDNFTYKNDIERIIQICKNQYAEAKIAYQTLAVYWRLYSSGIDGQTISYLVAEQPAG